MKTEINFFYGSKSGKVPFTLENELFLRKLLLDKELWSRVTPLGRKSVEPLFQDFQRVDSKHCVFDPGPYVGIVTFNDIKLIFNPPKWLNGLSSYHLNYMLFKSYSSNPKTVHLLELPENQIVSDIGLIEPIYTLFLKETLSALAKGKYKTYKKESKISSKLQGKVNLKMQMKLDMTGRPLFATEQYVFTEANETMELLFWSSKFIEKNTQNLTTRYLSKEILKIIPYFNSFNLQKMMKVTIGNRGKHLRWAVNLAKLILKNQSLSYYGREQKLFSTVINLFDVFEKYVFNELHNRDSKFTDQFELKLSPNNIDVKWKERRVYPDIIYRNNPPSVLDTKMKNIPTSGPLMPDIQQVYFYASLLGINQSTIIYPTNKDEALIKTYSIDFNQANEIQIVCYGLPIVGNAEQLTTAIDDLYEYIRPTMQF